MKDKIEKNPLISVATFIVDRRNLFFLIFTLLIIFSVIKMDDVGVEDDLAAYLPEDTATSRGLDRMDEEFITYGSARIMITNIAYDDAEALSKEIEARDDVAMLDFDETSEHYNNFSALFDVTFDFAEDDERAIGSLNEIRELLADYDIYVSSDIGNSDVDMLNEEMKTISVLVAIVVVSVLFLTSMTYAEVPVLLMTFGASALIAAGTNFLLGTISFVSHSVTIILQLALSVDYAIMLCNRYKEEHETLGIREACIISLSKAIPEISSSSLTTIGGLFAMIFMQYGIGRDLAVCLIKAIIFSLITVFTLMPGLLMIFGPWMDKTKHRSFIPKISLIGKYAYATRYVVPVLFVILIAGAFVIQKKCPYVFGKEMIETPIKNDRQIAKDMIKESFGEQNVVALIVPAGDYAKEKRMLETLDRRSEVDHSVGLANTEGKDEYMLTDKLTIRQFSELFDMDYEEVQLLYMAYAAKDENYTRIVNGISSYSVPLIDMILYLYDEVEENYLEVDDDVHEDIVDAHDKILIAKDQLQGENYSRMLVYLTLPEESDETFAFLDEMYRIAERFYDEDVLIVGNSTSEYDLKKTFNVDNSVVNVVSILAVLIVMLFTFMSVGMPLMLIIVIQGAIWVNFSFPYLQHRNLFFLSYLIVSSIQMGANIDYAILIAGRFLEVKDRMNRKDAIIETMNFAFPTIITSGSMMVLAGFSIGQLTSDGAICGIGQCLWRGTVISILFVMLVLPQILLLGEKVIDKSSFKVSVPLKLNRETGLMRVDGFVQGQFNGRIVGEIHAVMNGDFSAMVQSGQAVSIGEEQIGEGIRLIADNMARKKGEETGPGEQPAAEEAEEGSVEDGDSDGQE